MVTKHHTAGEENWAAAICPEKTEKIGVLPEMQQHAVSYSCVVESILSSWIMWFVTNHKDLQRLAGLDQDHQDPSALCRTSISAETTGGLLPSSKTPPTPDTDCLLSSPQVGGTGEEKDGQTQEFCLSLLPQTPVQLQESTTKPFNCAIVFAPHTQYLHIYKTVNLWVLYV